MYIVSKRRQQHKQSKAYYSQGQQVGDKHQQRQSRGEQQVNSERAVCNEEYDLSWFKPSVAQKSIIYGMSNHRCTIVEAPSGCGKSSTIIFQALKMMKTGKFDKILFIKTPSTLGLDDLGALSTNEVKFDVHLEAMRSIFHSFMSPEKLEMEERLGRIEFKFPNWCGGETWDKYLVVIDENQWISPEINKLLLERCTDKTVVVVAGDSKQRYSTKWRKDGFTDLIQRVTEVNEDGERVASNELFHYVRLTHSENRRGDFSRFITENYDNLDMS